MIFVASKIGLTLRGIKTALAAAVAWLAATTLFSGPYPYFAPLAAILTIQVTIAGSLKAAIQRFAGIIGGIIISMLVGYWSVIGTLSIFIMIMAGMMVSTVLNLSPQVTSQIGMSSLLVLAISHGHGPSYAIARIYETLVGSFVAIIINAVVFPPNAIPPAEKQVVRLGAQAADTLKVLSSVLESSNNETRQDSNTVDSLIEETGKGIKAIRLAEESLKYSPFTANSRHKLRRLVAGMERLEYVTIQIRGIRKGLLDLDLNSLSMANRQKLKAAIETTAACLRLYGDIVVKPAPSTESSLNTLAAKAFSLQLECLIAMREVSKPGLLRDFGAILTDLDRIVKGITKEPV